MRPRSSGTRPCRTHLHHRPRRSLHGSRGGRQGRSGSREGTGSSQAVGYPLAILSGLLFAISFPKFGHPAFAWIALAPLLVSIATIPPSVRAPRRAFVLGVLTGFVYFVGTLYWVTYVMAGFGGLAIPVAASLAGLLALLSRAVYRTVRPDRPDGPSRRFGVAGIWFAPVFWVATEWLRGDRRRRISLGAARHIAGDGACRSCRPPASPASTDCPARRARQHGGRGDRAQPANRLRCRRRSPSPSCSSVVVAWPGRCAWRGGRLTQTGEAASRRAGAGQHRAGDEVRTRSIATRSWSATST